MASGGPRKGAGRPKGAGTGAVAIPPSARKAVQDALVERIKGVDITPLDVMLTGMKLHYDESRTAQASAEAAGTKKESAELRKLAKTEIAASMSYAKELAPYLHAKLQSVTLKGDAENPLEISLGLASAEDLRRAIRGGK